MAISVQDALAFGGNHLMSKRSKQIAAADHEKAVATYRQANWPIASLTTLAERSDALSNIETPNGNFSAGKYGRGQLQLVSRMPLLNPSAQTRSEADLLFASASSSRAFQVGNDYAMNAANRYFDVLDLANKIGIAKNLLHIQQVKFDRISGLYAAGRVLYADLLKSRVETEQNVQNVARLEGNLRVAQIELGYACGFDQALKPIELAQQTLPVELTEALPEEHLIQKSLDNRADILALQQRVLGLYKRADATHKELRSANIDLVVQHTERRGIALLPKQESSIAIQLNLMLFNGVSTSQERAFLHELHAEELLVVDTKKKALLEYERLHEELTTQLNLKVLSTQQLEVRAQRLALVNALNAFGRAQIDELRQAEVEHENQKLNAAIVDIEIVRIRLKLRHVLGMKMFSVDSRALNDSGKSIYNMESKMIFPSTSNQSWSAP
jgi:outer membrane protein TolC